MDVDGPLESSLDLLALLEEHEAAFAESAPRYAALLAARAARGTAAAAPAGAGGAGAGAAPAAARAPTTARELLAESARAAAAGGATRAAYPELANDPALFRVPLLAAGAVWDSMRAMSSGTGAGAGAGAGELRVEPFIAKLPRYSADAAHGCNTLVLRAEYSALPDERAYAAVSIGGVEPGAEPVAALAADVRAHVSLRVDPDRRGAGGLRHRYTQAFKTRGTWDSARAASLALSPATWPVEKGRPFFLRITLDARGVFSYVDGRAMAFTRHPSGEAWLPAADPNLHVILPVAGDAAEKSTWRVLGAWWGHCAVDGKGHALADRDDARAAAAGPATRRELVPDEVYVTGLRPGTAADDVRDAFARFGALDARVDASGAAATLRLPPGTDVAAVVAATDRRAAVLGTTVNVRQSERVVAVG